MDQRRDLLRQPGAGDLEQAAAKEMQKGISAVYNKMLRREAWSVARRIGKTMLWITPILLVAFILPAGAFFEAERVRQCQAPRTTAVGLFAVRGTQSTVTRLGEDGTEHGVMSNRRLHYLGHGDDKVVFFDCDSDRTVQLPGGVVVDSAS